MNWRVWWRAEVLLDCYGYREWVDICYVYDCPPDFDGELRVCIDFAGANIVLFVGYAYQWCHERAHTVENLRVQVC